MRNGPSRGTDRVGRSLWTCRPPVSRQSPASSPWASCCASRPTSPAVRLWRSKKDKSWHPLFLSPHPKVALGRGLFYVGEGRPLGRRTAGRLACCIGRVAVLAMVGRDIARRAFGDGCARHPVSPARRPGPGSRYMQRGSASPHGLGGGDGLRGPLCIRRPRLSCGLLLWEARRGACACGGPNPATWAA